MSAVVFPQSMQTNIILALLQTNAAASIYEDWYGLGNTA